MRCTSDASGPWLPPNTFCFWGHLPSGMRQHPAGLLTLRSEGKRDPAPSQHKETPSYWPWRKHQRKRPSTQSQRKRYEEIIKICNKNKDIFLLLLSHLNFLKFYLHVSTLTVNRGVLCIIKGLLHYLKFIISSTAACESSHIMYSLHTE